MGAQTTVRHSTMSLSKIPFVIASAISIHVSLTTSSPPPSSEEKVMPTAFESSIKWFMAFRGLEWMKIGAWAVSSAEVANILAMHIDPSGGIYGARAVQLLRSLHPTPITPTFLAGSLAITIGGLFRLYCISTLGKFWSFQLSVRKEHRLVTSGPYSVVRHPSYTGLLLQSVGIMIMYGSPESWMRQSGILQVPFMSLLAANFFVLFGLCVWIGVTRPAIEDKMLKRALGKEWENWAKEVKYRLIPGVY
ncbi:hypothetical protein DEU56DRAFT_813617 [Suillus clintonianus]|uniref:uncharacterized protein n=1 Tax=Suillus clintonianus TaxID=1904413 RepID=UPI001B879AFF|nr:uncharacterized protein DEU56DRAFT_813617 [Suillus clintonianus]KAG2131645.1 hypothetical protein DEU56DRAFT_813617 [Suillus clintonianus]